MSAESEKLKNHITELEEKVARQNQAIGSYRDQLLKVTEHKSERDLYSELASVFARETGVDTVYAKTIDALSLHFKIRYAGVFLLDAKNDEFAFCYGKGYNAGALPPVPYIGSFMGQCLFKREILWEPAFAKRPRSVQLGQDPQEQNVVCAPLVLLGTEAGVVRCANIDAAGIDKVKPVLRTVTQLLVSTLERLMLQSRNEWTLRSLDTSFSIARLLENTIDKQQILSRVCAEVPRLLGCAGCMLAMKDPAGAMVPVARWPDGFELAGNQSSGAIYLRNLVEAFPAGNALIPDVHRDDRRWSWPDPKVRSLCMAPIRQRDVLHGVLIAVGTANEIFDHAHEDLLGIVASQASVTLERASYFLKQEDQARLDGLTGLYNRRMFQEMLAEEIARVKRYSHSLSLMMMDIDHFKKCNDTFGHPVGDEVIRMVARSIKSMIRATDHAFRYGGEEFAVLLPETASGNGHVLAERLRAQIESDRSVRGVTITISCGLTGVLPNDSPDSFVKRSDAALYTAKESGRNRVVIL
jgi:diguanylate cyclase (GGDEF)-like protein